MNILKGVNARFRPGVTAVVGRNGAGKTTMMRVITGVLPPDLGEVRRGSESIFADSKSLAGHRRTLGWLPQEPAHPSVMTVGGVVSYAAWLKKMPWERRSQDVREALERVDLVEHEDKRMRVLSGGQRRRASLAAAMVGTPSLLLLDEPTVGLDPMQRERLLARVRMFGSHGTVLLSTHLLEDVALAADGWLALADGQVVAHGSLDRSTSASLDRSLAEIRMALLIKGDVE